MTPPLFRVDAVPAVGGTVTLTGAEGRHAGAALRVRAGETIRVGDGRGELAECEVTEGGGDGVTAVVRERRSVPRPSPTVTVVQALPKSERSELAVELATEAGADRIVPWQAERCVSRWTGAKVERGRAKWANAVRVAAKQSRRPWEPEVAAPVDGAGLRALVEETVAAGGRALLLHEEGAVPLAEAVWASGPESPRELVLVIGPEGGISDGELAALGEAGARGVVLGPEVVRTSTAAALALGALGVLTRRWPGPGTTLGAREAPPAQGATPLEPPTTHEE